MYDTNDIFNGTIQNISLTSNLTFQDITNITITPYFIISALIVWLIPILLWLLLGAIVRGKSPDGSRSSKPMILYPNFWYAFSLWFFIQGALFIILLIFPFWLKIFT